MDAYCPEIKIPDPEPISLNKLKFSQTVDDVLPYGFDKLSSMVPKIQADISNTTSLFKNELEGNERIKWGITCAIGVQLSLCDQIYDYTKKYAWSGGTSDKIAELVYVPIIKAEVGPFGFTQKEKEIFEEILEMGFRIRTSMDEINIGPYGSLSITESGKPYDPNIHNVKNDEIGGKNRVSMSMSPGIIVKTVDKMAVLLKEDVTLY